MLGYRGPFISSKASMNHKSEKLIVALILTLLTILVGITIASLSEWSEHREDKVMALEYCFTESGEHYQCD